MPDCNKIIPGAFNIAIKQNKDLYNTFMNNLMLALNNQGGKHLLDNNCTNEMPFMLSDRVDMNPLAFNENIGCSFTWC
jgi:hypothetical protein